MSRNGKVNAGPDLPVAKSGHCMVQLTDGRILVHGGYPTKNYIFDSKDDTFVFAPDSLHDRYSHGCTVFNSTLHNGRSVVIVAGGYSNSNLVGIRISEVWDYTRENSTWEERKYMFFI